ncbi:MAG: hypothetical protein KAU41_07675 [Deltaproteobacteria bacterium]|nr:hypothetical protein [Pseudomonadota bacterium]MCK4604551.1 hypothetical protein [Deltaproteobacteria bacterium]
MMNEPVDMVTLVRDLPSRPRGRACIVLTHEYGGQKEWAAELGRQTRSEHIDLLELFTQEKTLGDKVVQFLVPKLFDFLESRSQAPVLIVSGMEFLKATWTGQSNAVKQFASRIQTWNKNPCLLFVLQYDKILATYDFGKRHQYTYIVDQRETLAP